MAIMPALDNKLCDGCGLCVAACYGGAIIQEEGKVRIIETETCGYCGVCEAVCPRYAIKCAYIIVLCKD